MTKKPTATDTPPRSQRTPVSSSAVVKRGRVRARPSDSEPPPLTPYQARLDVEMDDTAISKVRDPSVSISLDADQLLPLPPPPERRRPTDPVYSMVVGAILGAVLVAILVLLVRVVFR